MKKNWKKALKLLAKISLSFVALGLVFQKVSFEEVLETAKSVHPIYFLLAILAYHGSKWVGAFRLNYYWKAIGIDLSFRNNLILYYIGMFYNLFLPGGIGGDGYKVWVLKKGYSGNTRDLIQAVLLDRISGVVALFFILLLFFTFSSPPEVMNYPLALPIVLLLLVFPLSWVFHQAVFRRFQSVFFSVHWLGLAVQCMQVLTASFIFFSLSGAENLHWAPVMILFLAAAVLSILPLTIGGVGIRELTFLYGAKWYGMDPGIAITFSLLFFMINAICSFTGIFLTYRQKKSLMDRSS